jgi:hypothetical protein
VSDSRPGSGAGAGAGPGDGAARLIRALVEPESVAGLSAADWSDLIARARSSRLGGRLAYRLEGAIGSGAVPEPVAGMLLAERRAADRQAQIARWEVACIRRALAGTDAPVVLLKGAAYILAGLDMARGRVVTDVDFLVPRDALDAVERSLLAAGWVHIKQSAYDQKYYREYAHELPPLVHRERHTVIDVHHTLVPVTSRLAVDPAALLAAAEPIGDAGLFRLASADMLAHAAVHLFHDGEIAGNFRELVDIDGLVRDLAGDPGFWPAVLDRARRPGLGRPLFHALRYARRHLGTPVPEEAGAGLARFGPSPPVRAAMDRLVDAALLPGPPFPDRRKGVLARQILFFRSHWLKMPPLLLLRHGLHKARRPRPKASG